MLMDHKKKKLTNSLGSLIEQCIPRGDVYSYLHYIYNIIHTLVFLYNT